MLLKNFEHTLEKLSAKELQFSEEHRRLNQEERSILTTWIEVFNSGERIYNIITKKILNAKTNKEAEDIDILISNITQLLDIKISKDESKNEQWERFILKTLDHLKLAKHQSDSFREQNRLADSTIKNVNAIIKKLNDRKIFDEEQYEKIQNTTIKIDLLDDKHKNMQKEFIAILGIFASILITAFGGLTALGSLFKKIDKTDIHKLIFVGTFEVLAIILIIFLMLNGIAKLTKLNLRSCDCKADEKCVCKLHEKHPSMVMISAILLIVLGISSTPILTQKILAANKEGNLITYLIMYGLCAIFFLILGFVFYRLNEHKLFTLNKKLMKYKFVNLRNREDFFVKREQLYYEKKIYLDEKEKNLQLLLNEFNDRKTKIEIRIEKLKEIEKKISEIEKAYDQ